MNSTSFPVEEEQACFMANTLEPVSVPMQYFFFVLYSLTSFASIVGNVVVIIVQWCTKPNHNIHKYLSNLAVSDLLISIMSVPFTYTNMVLGHWPFPPFLCSTAQFAQLLGVFVTSTTLMIIGIERYFVTLRPLSQSSRMIKSHSTELLAFFWIVGIVYAYIPVENTHANPFTLNGQVYYQCVNDESTLGHHLFIVLNFLLTFLLPLLIMTVSYVAIMNKLRNSRSFIAKFLSSNDNRCAWVFIERHEEITNSQLTVPKASLDQRSKTIKMMLIVLAMYCICWTPVKVFQCLQFYGYLSFCTEKEFLTLVYAYIFCHWLAMANCMVNPVIYSFFSSSFRKNFWKILLVVRDSVSFNLLNAASYSSENNIVTSES